MTKPSARRWLWSASAGLGASAVLLIGANLVAAPASASAGHTAVCSNPTSVSPRTGPFAGVVPARPTAASVAACPPSIGPDPSASGGSPPLINHGGPMMSTRSNADKVVVTPIYWEPSGYPVASSYSGLINRFLSDAAHDSDLSTNVFSTLFEYNGSNGYINYRIRRGTPITDTTPFPAAGCTTDPGPVYHDNSGYTTCLDDAQIQAEINSRVSSLGLPRDLGHMYVIFLPKHVESCFYPAGTPGQACTVSSDAATAAYCAYHSQFTASGLPTVYANMPFPIYAAPPSVPYTCGSDATLPTDESPNGNTDADVEISPLSHEMSEAITDPDTSTGWYDSSGYENGDECAYEYGATSGAAGALYNQTIDGHHYLTQEEFSNNNYNLGQGGCLQSYVPASKPSVINLSAHSGSTAGGNTITVVGSTLGGASAVYFGTVAATAVQVVDPTRLRVTVPAHGAGTVAVTVLNVLGTSSTMTKDRYTYS